MAQPDDLAVEGNAVAGSPGQIFAIDVTAAEVTCPDCGGNSPLADEKSYLRGEGSLLQCKHCSSVLGRFRRSQTAIWVDLRSMPGWQVQIPH
jgi:predicted RNA-binding Zn-ribbon protein involved in translation (DUF1610 family)